MAHGFFGHDPMCVPSLVVIFAANHSSGIAAQCDLFLGVLEQVRRYQFVVAGQDSTCCSTDQSLEALRRDGPFSKSARRPPHLSETQSY
jgi:hypothetical protein